MDREAWPATVHGVTKSQTRLCDWAHMHAFHIWFKRSQCLEHSQMETSWGWMDGADVESASWGVFACESRKDRRKRPVSEEAPEAQRSSLVCVLTRDREWLVGTRLQTRFAGHGLWGQRHILLGAELAQQAECWWMGVSEGLWLLWNRRRDAHRGRGGCRSEWGGGVGGRGNIAATGVRGDRLRHTDGRMGRSAVGSEPRREGAGSRSGPWAASWLSIVQVGHGGGGTAAIRSEKAPGVFLHTEVLLQISFCFPFLLFFFSLFLFFYLFSFGLFLPVFLPDNFWWFTLSYCPKEE